MKEQTIAFAVGMMMCICLYSMPARAQQGRKITITNASSVALTDKPVAVKRALIPAIPKGRYPLVRSAEGDTIPSQLDDLNGDGNWDELFFVAGLPANSTRTYSLTWLAAQPEYVKRTSIRFSKRMAANAPVQPATSETVYPKDLPKSIGFQRYQTDGPSWENDKVGFRHYLDGRNAKDVFGKRVAYMSPETVGINAKGAVEDNYHVMEAWGRDVLAVGNSIGIGGVALMKGNSMMRLGVTVDDSVNNVEKTTFNIVSEGPVRSVMHFSYRNWKPAGGGSYNVDETTSIWPGMYAYHNSVKISALQSDEHLAIGMVNINSAKQPEVIKLGTKWVALVSHDRHTYNKEWWIGLALILPADAYLGYADAPKQGKLSNTFLAKLKTGSNPVDYYSVACWELSDEGFKDPAYFQRYVENLVEQLSATIKVTVQ